MGGIGRPGRIFSILAAVTGVFLALQLSAGTGLSQLKKLSPDNFKRLYADSWRAVGQNIIIEGNAYLPVGELEIFADQIIVNTHSRDFEAAGNIRIFRWQEGSGSFPLEKIAAMERAADLYVREVVPGYSLFGEAEYKVKYAVQADKITADKVTGNLASGYFSMINPAISYATFVCKADSGVRTPDGVITLKGAEVSSCRYLESDSAHYSIAASEIRLTPHEARFYEMKHADFDRGDRSILLINGIVKVYGIPVFWLPAFYKPKDENPGIAGFQYGKSSSLGYYINLYKQFVLTDDPYSSVKLHADWYEKRGFGYGAEGRIVAPESRTDFFVYSIYDRDRYETDDYDDFRLSIPKSRFDFRISNVTHITPRLDFRGVFDYQSDPYFKRDFFTKLYDQDPQPATFAALEQQFDRFGFSLYSRWRVNDFYTVTEKFPELRMDMPRQEIFDTGIYYQSETSAAYMRRKWIDFDDDPPRGYSKLKDYDNFRFDTTHFFYYPIANRYFSLVPRAGFRLTTYSHTSKGKVRNEDLQKMFAAVEPQSDGRYRFNNYDRKGGSKVRLIGELGFELSTKFHNTWQDLQSGFFRIDGLRHIVQPYMNYTFIPKPTLDRKKIYFFDDVDRITKQNFVRFGVVNRLQTRRGNSVEDLLYMENYWDIHMEKEDGLSQCGNVGTLMSLKLFKGLSVNTEFLIDVAGDSEVADTIRHGRNAGKTGLALDWLNLWNINVTYSPAKDWEFSFGYKYTRPYSMRSSYSMGSTLTQVNAASYFEQFNNETDESFYLNAALPLTPDRRTMGEFFLTYDVTEGSLDKIGLAVLRKFHCWQLVATVGFDRDYDDGWEWDVEYSVTANLTGLNDVMNNTQNVVLQQLDTAVSSIKF